MNGKISCENVKFTHGQKIYLLTNLILLKFEWPHMKIEKMYHVITHITLSFTFAFFAALQNVIQWHLWKIIRNLCFEPGVRKCHKMRVCSLVRMVSWFTNAYGFLDHKCVWYHGFIQSIIQNNHQNVRHILNLMRFTKHSTFSIWCVSQNTTSRDCASTPTSNYITTTW